MTTVETLRAARARITDPANFCRHDFHAGGASCGIGALEDVGGLKTEEYGWHQTPAHYALLRAVGMSTAPGGASFAAYNDFHSHAEVLAAFDRAISYEEAIEEEHAWRAFLPAALDLVPA